MEKCNHEVMSVFRIRKVKFSKYEKIINKFNVEMEDAKTTEQYDNINKVFTYIKIYYEKKNKDKKFSIKAEKIRIEDNIGSNASSIISFSMAYYIAIIGSLFYFMFELVITAFNKYSNEINVGLTIAFLLTMLFFSSYIIGEGIKKEGLRNLRLNISLKVLENIEKEIADEQKREKEEVGKLEIQRRIEEHLNRGTSFRTKFVNI